MTIEKLFFELLQVAIGNRNSMSVVPTKEQWTELFALSKKQALMAVAFAGVNRLKEACASSNGWDSGIGIDEKTYLKWLGLTAKIAQRNKELSAACASLCKDLAHDGMYSCILKGQSNLVNYPEDLRECRTPGDIDVWCAPMDPCGIDIAVADLDGKGAHYEKYVGERGVIEWVLADYRIKDKMMPEVNYHHIDWEYEGIECEVHFKPSWLNNPWHNSRLQKWCKENEPWGVCDAMVAGFETNTIKTPSTDAGSMSPSSDGCLSASVSELPASYCQSSACIVTDTASDDGKKQEINRSGVIPVPTVSFNAVYQLCHIYRHLFNEGVGLRQLLDYYFVLRALHIEQGELTDSTPSMGQWDEGMGVSVKSKEEIMHTLGRFGLKEFTSAVMWVLALVFDPQDDFKTKTIKTPDGSAYVNESECTSELGTSVSLTSTDSPAAPIQPSGKKQEINHSLVVNDWQQRWPWMICRPDVKRGEFLLNEIMLAGNFGKYDTCNVIGVNEGYLKRFIRRQKRFMRFLSQYPSEVIWGPYFSIKQRLWRILHGWR